MNIELSGDGALDQRLQQLAVRSEPAGMKAQQNNANHLLGSSVVLAPVNTGDLRGSGNVNPIANGYEVRFSQRYSAKQHEELGYNHPRGGQAKYLEQPLEENRQRYLDHVAATVRKALE